MIKRAQRKAIREAAKKMRAEGASYRAIARHFGRTVGWAHFAVNGKRKVIHTSKVDKIER